MPVDPEREVAEPPGQLVAEELAGLAEGDVLVVLPLLRLRGRREDRRIEPLALLEPLGEGLAGERPALPVLLPGRAGDVAAHDALDQHGLGAVDQHRAAGPCRAARLQMGVAGHDAVGVHRDQVVRDLVLELLEPPRRHQREHLALAGDGLGKHDVERAHAVGGDHEQRGVVDRVDVADLAAVEELEVELGLENRCVIRHGVRDRRWTGSRAPRARA